MQALRQAAGEPDLNAVAAGPVYAGLGRACREEAVSARHDMIAGQRDRVITLRTAKKWLDQLLLEPVSGATLWCVRSDRLRRVLEEPYGVLSEGDAVFTRSGWSRPLADACHGPPSAPESLGDHLIAEAL